MSKQSSVLPLITDFRGNGEFPLLWRLSKFCGAVLKECHSVVNSAIRYSGYVCKFSQELQLRGQFRTIKLCYYKITHFNTKYADLPRYVLAKLQFRLKFWTRDWLFILVDRVSNFINNQVKCIINYVKHDITSVLSHEASFPKCSSASKQTLYFTESTAPPLVYPGTTPLVQLRS